MKYFIVLFIASAAVFLDFSTRGPVRVEGDKMSIYGLLNYCREVLSTNNFI